MNLAAHKAAHEEACRRHTADNCEGCKIGRTGLVWLIHECTDRGVGFYYRYRISVEVFDHGVSFGLSTWSVPTLGDAAYQFADKPALAAVAS